ncbi:chemotaxis protein CheW [Pseudoduganella buxea]|nr:chemotaxis protein CheW [Pseudoduganella buxea]GGC22379.1 hypothetical protein GCM10011572_49830 [Pseudoduganella buxea]
MNNLGFAPVEKQERHPVFQQYITFNVAEVEYAVELSVVQEVRSLRALIRTNPDNEVSSGSAIVGHMLVHLVDLRAQSERSETYYLSPTVIIVRLPTGVCGIIVEKVTGIEKCAVTQPFYGRTHDSGRPANIDFIIGYQSIGGRNIVVIDVPTLLQPILQ